MLSLIRHLRKCKPADAVLWAQTWLAEHSGDGELSADAAAEAAAEAGERRTGYARRILDEAGDPLGTVAETYLRSRGLEPPYPACVRFLPDARLGEGAIVGVLNTPDGETVGVQLGYLDPNGRKSTVQPQRELFLVDREKAEQGAFRINVAEPAKDAVLLVEGLENAVAIARAGAARDLLGVPGVGRFGKLNVQAGAEVTIFVDGKDAADSPAARALDKATDRWSSAGVRVRATATPTGEDANSLLQAQGAEAVRQLVAEARQVKKPSRSGSDKQADVLITLAKDAALFHSPDGVSYADFEARGRETWPVRSKGFRNWLSLRYWQEVASAPNSDAMQAALAILEAQAQFEGPERAVHVRVAGADGKLYVDLCDDAWRAVEVHAGGWRIVPKPPVRFRRKAGMLPLPWPTHGGSVRDLWRFLNVRGEEDFCLVIAWAVAALRDYGPYPVLVPTGEQGSAKSSLCEILKLLIDPNTAPLRALPREDRDLFIAATNSHVLAFDNVSGLPSWISDTLCRLATGGGFAVRQLYTDQDEVLFNEQRPAILNGIEDVVTRPDLADRSIFLQLEPIPEDKRRPYAELMGAFERTRPAILGALLTTAAYGLRTLPSTHLMRMPRMADFAKWATACEGALWPAGTFADAYDENRRHAIATCIEADPIVAAVYEFMQGRTEWTGTASDLLSVLTSAASETLRRARAWPQTPRVLSGRLTRAATFLRKAGINIDRERGGQKRTITIRAVGAGHFASPQSQPSSQSDINALGSDDEGGGTSSLASQPSVSPGNGSDANKLPSDANKSSSVTANSLKTNSNDDDDDNDAEIHLSPAEPVCPTPKYAAMAAPHMRHLGTASKTRTRDRKNKKIKAFYG